MNKNIRHLEKDGHPQIVHHRTRIPTNSEELVVKDLTVARGKLNDDYDDRHSDEEITSKRMLIFPDNERVERENFVGDIKKVNKEIVMHAEKVGDGTAKETTFNERVKSSIKITGHVSKGKAVRSKRYSVKKFNHLKENVKYEKEDSSDNDHYVSKSSKSV
ncbi:hypothetical protein ACFE04_018633 [Oxalis oulophora]